MTGDTKDISGIVCIGSIRPHGDKIMLLLISNWYITQTIRMPNSAAKACAHQHWIAEMQDSQSTFVFT